MRRTVTALVYILASTTLTLTISPSLIAENSKGQAYTITISDDVNDPLVVRLQPNPAALAFDSFQLTRAEQIPGLSSTAHLGRFISNMPD